jgi:NhaP-type Na+/H+ or K+/H+ antiporter
LFAAGAFVGMLALSLVARTVGLRLGEPGEDVARHIITMVLGGLFIGAAIGLLSARLIAKRLRPAGPRLKPDS